MPDGRRKKTTQRSAAEPKVGMAMAGLTTGS